jgi:hypothetical protein
MFRSAVVVLSAALTALALLCAPAGAQQRAAVVAGPLPEGASLVAFDRGGRLCLQVRMPGGESESVDCLDEIPDVAGHSGFNSVGQPPGGVWFGAVTPDVATVEMRFFDGERVAAPTSAGPAYRGRFAGRVRFALLGSRTPQVPYLIRLLAADGHVIAALGNPFARAPILRAPATFASGRAGGARWTAQAFVHPELRATPLERDRLERVACVGLGPLRREPFGPAGLRAQACADEGPMHAAVTFGVDSSCRADGTAVTGLVAARVERLVAVLGDGRRRTIAVHALPAAFAPGRRAFAFAAGRDTAVRRIDALDAAGRRVMTLPLGLAPGRISCGAPDFADVFIISPGAFATPGSRLTPPPGPPRLLVADDGVRLCFSIGRFGADGIDCGLPPIEFFESRVLRQTTPQGTLVAGVVPADVARVRVRLGGGGAIVVPTTPTVPGYTGRYAAAVRFFTLPLARPRRVVATDLITASGRRLGRLPGPDLAFPAATTTLVRMGGVRVGAASFAGIPCIAIGAVDCVPRLDDSIDVTATCAPRRIAVTALLGARDTGLEVRLRDGRTVRARIVRLRGAGGLRRRFAVLVVGARATPSRLILRRGSRPSVSRPLAVPPAARQCGYSAAAALVTFGSGRPETR